MRNYIFMQYQRPDRATFMQLDNEFPARSNACHIRAVRYRPVLEGAASMPGDGCSTGAGGRETYRHHLHGKLQSLYPAHLRSCVIM
jgi:hypothetical protein